MIRKICPGGPPERAKSAKHDSKMVPKWLQNDSGCSLFEPLGRLLGRSCLLGRSWRLLGRCWSDFTSKKIHHAPPQRKCRPHAPLKLPLPLKSFETLRGKSFSTPNTKRSASRHSSHALPVIRHAPMERRSRPPSSFQLPL